MITFMRIPEIFKSGRGFDNRDICCTCMDNHPPAQILASLLIKEASAIRKESPFYEEDCVVFLEHDIKPEDIDRLLKSLSLDLNGQVVRESLIYFLSLIGREKRYMSRSVVERGRSALKWCLHEAEIDCLPELSADERINVFALRYFVEDNPLVIETLRKIFLKTEPVPQSVPTSF